MSRYRVSLLPKLFAYWQEALERPHRRFLDRGVTMTLHPDHFFGPSVFHGFDRMLGRQLENYSRPWSEFLREHLDEWSVVKSNKNALQVSLDVQEFKPEEINVRLTDGCIIIEGKHEDREDEHGTISRHFIRKYVVPEQCDPEKATSTLSSDGVLTIKVPKRPEAIDDEKERVINIEHTGKPAVDVEAEIKPTARE